MNTVFSQFPFFGQSQPTVRLVGVEDIVLGLRVEDEKGGGGSKKGEPVIVTRDLLKQGHIHARGRTRSGKTSLILSPLALKLMEEYELSWTDSQGRQHTEMERDAIFVFDLGGDLALFNAVREKAHALGRQFSYFSLDPKCSYYFDPFQSVKADELRVIRICNLLVEAMHLDYGLVYGGSYYTHAIWRACCVSPIAPCRHDEPVERPGCVTSPSISTRIVKKMKTQSGWRSCFCCATSS